MSQSVPAFDPIAAGRQELADIIQRHCQGEGLFETAIDSLLVARGDCPNEGRMPTLYRPALCVIAQGCKEVRLGSEVYRYDELNLLVVSVTLPVSGQVIEASPDRPYLSIRLDIDPGELTRLIAEAGLAGTAPRPASRGIYLQRLDCTVLDALLRLMRLLDTPRDIEMLAPLFVREILYRLLRGPQGHLLHDLAMTDSQTHRVTRAIEWLNRNYDKSLRIEDLAREVNLSVSTLHHRFKEVTALSPLQYQKQLRLQEARRLMLSEGLEVAVAGHRVGYESPSQFSREYSRLFGAPPLRDLASLRGALGSEAVPA
ncbi:AraC family transcriptional regulator N-terminal domain-containing protein [Pseudomonas sp. BGr12]|uniref:AraC family transcriptional regulator n=1 Tax=Pseudomonas denitrificans TaxID=43306 RepID=A0A9X7N3Z2_PSEDE|nr:MULTISPECIES: AraC family transcriptional regulator [Pseudomonadaceae]OQR32133.1 AraC family transcriptional regulator [Pseudomonas sp. T]MBD9502489.1 AraC family transcriptional regulator [Pseudomonas sp. PDM17]MBD9514926.1 AraC family transcriptional regulator [Pseudomonas sp. PDM22]MBD9577351.1 AraC family transcriptional regulator [Pseudomonas sp. PDM23]MBD9634265.1 AraC family transcriptional regulator [Pseudomonas sp. PDM19]